MLDYTELIHNSMGITVQHNDDIDTKSYAQYKIFLKCYNMFGDILGMC